MAISYRQVEVFRALMLTCSVTKTAELLFTSQPTISRELARIEYTFGFVLFDRTHGRLRPTASALALYDEVKRVYVGLDRIESTVARLRRHDGGQLSIITLPAFSHSILPGACQRFHATHPGANILIASQESPILEEWLSAQRYDLGLTEHDTPPAGTKITPLIEVEEVCVLPDAHPLLAKRVIALSDFAHQPFISLSSDDPYRSQLDKAFASMGIERTLVVETPTAVSVCSLVRKGVGLSIINPFTALDFLGQNLHIRPLEASYPFRISLVHPEHRPINSLATAFIESLRGEALRLQRRLKELLTESRT